MSASTSPSLANIIEVVGPVILSFLSEKDILCSLQYASFDIWRFCVNTREIWKEFINRYFLGQILQQEGKINPNTLCILTDIESNLLHLDEIPNNVLFSIITSMTPAKDITGIHHDDHHWTIKRQVADRISPFNKIKVLQTVWWVDTEIHLQLYWTGQWGVFWRLQFERGRGNELPVNIEFTVKGHKYPFEGSLTGDRTNTPEAVRKIVGSKWVDYMYGVIDARNVLYGQEFQGKQQRFERLHVPIDIKVRFYNYEGVHKTGQYFDFAYLWPLEDHLDSSLYNEAQILLNPKDNETAVKLQVIGNVTTIKVLPTTDRVPEAN